MSELEPGIDQTVDLRTPDPTEYDVHRVMSCESADFLDRA